MLWTSDFSSKIPVRTRQLQWYHEVILSCSCWGNSERLFRSTNPKKSPTCNAGYKPPLESSFFLKAMKTDQVNPPWNTGLRLSAAIFAQIKHHLPPQVIPVTDRAIPATPTCMLGRRQIRKGASTLLWHCCRPACAVLLVPGLGTGLLHHPEPLHFCCWVFHCDDKAHAISSVNGNTKSI